MKSYLRVCLLPALGLAALLGASPLSAQQDSSQQDEEALRKAAQNPVASLISLPVQSNNGFQIGEFERTSSVNNIQPVLPFSLGSKWTLITRTILPVLYAPDVTAETGGQWGWSDLNMSLFFSPKGRGGLIWGVGPAIVAPIASSPELGSGKWSIGPTVVALAMPGNWVIGALWNQVWSFAGNDERADVNQMLIQPFINFNLPKGWYLTTSPIWTANWEAESGEKWLVPLGGGAGKIFALGPQRFNGAVQLFFPVVHPDTNPYPKWQLRVQIQALFPKG